jgi:hypothetical protein
MFFFHQSVVCLLKSQWVKGWVFMQNSPRFQTPLGPWVVFWNESSLPCFVHILDPNAIIRSKSMVQKDAVLSAEYKGWKKKDQRKGRERARRRTFSRYVMHGAFNDLVCAFKQDRTGRRRHESNCSSMFITEKRSISKVARFSRKVIKRSACLGKTPTLPRLYDKKRFDLRAKW